MNRPPENAAADSIVPKRLPATVVALGWASLLTDVASEMIFPLLPRFIDRELGGGKIGIGLVEGVAETVSSLLRLPGGVWSDRLARRKPLVFAGYGVAGVIRPLMGLVATPLQAVVIRALDRVGKGIRSAPRDALLADAIVPDERGRAFGFHRAMDHAGAALGPLLAFAFLTFWPNAVRTLFLLSIVPGISVLVVLWWGVREAKHVNAPEPAAKVVEGRSAGWSLAAFSPRFRWFLLALVLFALGGSSDAFLLRRAEELGVSERLIPLLWLVFHVAKSGLNLIGGRWADRFSPGILLLAGWAIYAATYLGFGWATTGLHAWGLFLVYALHYGLTEPAEKLLVTQWVPAEFRGSAFGWFHLAVGLTALPANALFGAIWNSPTWGLHWAFGFTVATTVAATVVLGIALFSRGDGRQYPAAVSGIDEATDVEVG